MDHSWMHSLRTSREYRNGVEALIEFGQKNASDRHGMIYCPCVNCLNECRMSIGDVRNHLLCDGIQSSYKTWIWHGERALSSSDSSQQSVHENDVDADRMEEMINDVEVESFRQSHAFDDLRSDAETPLYPGSSFTRLSGTLQLMNIKASSGWTDSSFTMLLELLCKMLPAGNVLPNRMYEAKKVMSKMGLECQKIHSCSNDCVLYRNEYEGLSQCPKCETPRYKKSNKDDRNCGEKKKKRQPLKVMWYLPIVPRLKRLFANATNAKNLRWHADERVADGRYLRHPADSPQWKKIDTMYPEFGCEPRNIRLGLCTDGINPFGNMSSTHSAWPVLLVIYNLPPGLCMKRKYMMLSIMISGPKQPGNDIDVYLAPLIDDLKMLWGEGIDVFDAYKQESFKMRAMIFTIINDFPAYGNLSGYSVKGHTACPICEADTCFHQLKNGRKTVYLGHRRFLPLFHPYRRLRKSFNGLPENDQAPSVLTGDEVYSRVEQLNVTFSKNKMKTSRVVVN